jgi:hypothetical protein
MVKERRSPRRLMAAAACLSLGLVPPASAAEPDPITLPAVPGFARSGEVRRFGPATLYQQIDGASELYLSYGFHELLVADYTDGAGGSVAVEVYRHESPVCAFGIYSQERPRQGQYLEVGVEGYLEPPLLNLLSGDAYVKLSADGLGARTEEVLRAFAEASVAALGGAGRAPEALALFPAEGKTPHSEAFAAKDFLGYSFLRSGFTAEYAVGDARFQLFVVDGGTPEASAAMLGRYRKRAGLPPEPASAADTLVPDPYNGEVAVFRKGRFLGGALGLHGPPLRERYLESLRRAMGEGN